MTDPLVGQLLGVGAAPVLPGLERRVVEHLGPPERRFEIRLGMGAAEIVSARSDLVHGIERLPVFAQIDRLCQSVQDPELIGIHDEFLE